MATRKTRTTRKSKTTPEERLYRRLKASPAQLTSEQVDMFDAAFASDEHRVARRIVLQMLTKSGRELVAMAQESRGHAVAIAQAIEAAREIEKHMLAFSRLAQAMSVRLGIALCDRDDMDEVIAEARATWGQEQREASANPGRPPQPPRTARHRRLLNGWGYLSEEQRAAFMARMQATAAANATREAGHE